MQYMGDQEAMSRKSESLRKFSGNAADFNNWAKHMCDHMGKSKAKQTPELYKVSGRERAP